MFHLYLFRSVFGKNGEEKNKKNAISRNRALVNTIYRDAAFETRGELLLEVGINKVDLHVVSFALPSFLSQEDVALVKELVLAKAERVYEEIYPVLRPLGLDKKENKQRTGIASKDQDFFTEIIAGGKLQRSIDRFLSSLFSLTSYGSSSSSSSSSSSFSSSCSSSTSFGSTSNNYVYLTSSKLQGEASRSKKMKVERKKKKKKTPVEEEEEEKEEEVVEEEEEEGVIRSEKSRSNKPLKFAALGSLLDLADSEASLTPLASIDKVYLHDPRFYSKHEPLQRAMLSALGEAYAALPAASINVLSDAQVQSLKECGVGGKAVVRNYLSKERKQLNTKDKVQRLSEVAFSSLKERSYPRPSLEPRAAPPPPLHVSPSSSWNVLPSAAAAPATGRASEMLDHLVSRLDVLPDDFGKDMWLSNSNEEDVLSAKTRKKARFAALLSASQKCEQQREACPIGMTFSSLSHQPYIPPHKAPPLDKFPGDDSAGKKSKRRKEKEEEGDTEGGGGERGGGGDRIKVELEDHNKEDEEQEDMLGSGGYDRLLYEYLAAKTRRFKCSDDSALFAESGLVALTIFCEELIRDHVVTWKERGKSGDDVVGVGPLRGNSKALFRKAVDLQVRGIHIEERTMSSSKKRSARGSLDKFATRLLANRMQVLLGRALEESEKVHIEATMKVISKKKNRSKNEKV